MRKFLDASGLKYLWGQFRSAMDAKQDTLTGTAGQLVGFNKAGKAVAQDVNQIEIVRIDTSSFAPNGITFVDSEEELVGGMKYASCSIIGIGNVVDPGTGRKLNFGTLHFSSNVRLTQSYYAPEKAPLTFKTRIKSDDGKSIILNETFSVTSLRMMSFQGSLAVEAGKTPILEGTYSDVFLSKTDDTDGDLIIEVIPYQFLKPNNTFWIELQVPIAWEYA